MNKLRKQIALGFVALFATLCVISSCSEEEECMIDVAREQKVQELLKVSRLLADQHEIAMCFTEQMIRGGIDTLTVEDLEQAYEVYAANTVEFYVCTDSVKANENGLKLSRSSRMARETLLPGEGNTILASYELYWESYVGEYGRYDATLNVRIDWNNTGVSGVAVLFPRNFSEQRYFINSFVNTQIVRDKYGNLSFSTETSFSFTYECMYCYFNLWAEQNNYSQRVRLTIDNYNPSLRGALHMLNN